VGFVDAIRGTLYLDANVFVYALEGHTEFAAGVCELLSSISDGDVLAVTRELTLAELLVKPFRVGSAELQAAYLELLRDRAGLRIVPVSREVLIESARLRAIEAMRLPDGIHFATARLQRCEAFVSNDLRLRPHAGVRIVRIPMSE
jgi:predicted nucleic acid-binding protein